MLDILKQVILDYQDMPWECGIPRHLDMQSVPGKASVCVGVRRSGKSTYLFQRMRALREKGISRRNLLYMNFFDDRLHELRHTGPGLVTEAYFAMFPEKKNRETVYCFLDELQVIPGWESFVDRLLRTERVEVTITGSSADMLSREVATQMRGRALSWELFPFSFREFLDGEHLPDKLPLSTRDELLVRKAFERYWETGGFPEVRELSRPLRLRTHQEYFHALLYRDMIERHDIPHARAVLDLAHRLITDTASLFSINRLTGYLKSLGHKVPKASVSDYLQWFEDAYFLFTVSIFDPSITRRKTNPKKIYCIDHALAVSVGSGILLNSGHLLENLVFTALRRHYPEIFYYRTRSGREVDFVVSQPNGSRLLVQVCDNLSRESTRKRELTAIEEAMGEISPATGLVVTRNETETLTTSAGPISVLPAWRFLLDIDS